MAFAGMSIGCAHVSTHHVGMDAAMLGWSHAHVSCVALWLLPVHCRLPGVHGECWSTCGGLEKHGIARGEV